MTKKLLSLVFVLAAIVMAEGSFAQSSAEPTPVRTILNTFWNAYQPANQTLEIKNVDVIKVETQYLDFVKVTYEVRVYVWVKPNISFKTSDLDVINKDNTQQRSSLPAVRVGSDFINNNTFSIYEAVIPLKNEHFEMFLYAQLKYDGKVYYSNQNYPTQFFRVAN